MVETHAVCNYKIAIKWEKIDHHSCGIDGEICSREIIDILVLRSSIVVVRNPLNWAIVRAEG